MIAVYGSEIRQRYINLKDLVWCQINCVRTYSASDDPRSTVDVIAEQLELAMVWKFENKAEICCWVRFPCYHACENLHRPYIRVSQREVQQ